MRGTKTRHRLEEQHRKHNIEHGLTRADKLLERAVRAALSQDSKLATSERIAFLNAQLTRHIKEFRPTDVFDPRR